jgi:hypothetical protein
MYTTEEIQEFTDTLIGSLRRNVESGEHILPSGYAFYTVSPNNPDTPAKNLGMVCGDAFITGAQDIEKLSSVIRKVARSGQAQVSCLTFVARRSLFPAHDTFDTGADRLAVIYLDNVQGTYDVWFAPVVHRPEGTPTLGEFVHVEGILAGGQLPYILPTDLYGPELGLA